MENVRKITVENATFQQFQALRTNRKKRTKLGLFLVESVKAINLVIERNWPVHAVLYRDGEHSTWAQNVLAVFTDSEQYALSEALMTKLCDREEIPEIVLVANIRNRKLEEVSFGESPLIVVLDRPGSPGNLGSIIRSCDALGVDLVITTGHGADLYDPQTVRASIGTIFTMLVIQAESYRIIHEMKERLQGMNTDVQVVGTSARGDKEIGQIDFRKATILIIGNESVGMSERLTEFSDSVANIPIHGSASSLNVACATSIVLYEAIRQRRA